MELAPTFKNINSLHLLSHRVQRSCWMAARTSLEEETPDAALLRFLSFILLNWVRPHVAYLVNLSIYWRLCRLFGECCRINKDLQKRPLLIIWREDMMQKIYLFPIKERKHFSEILVHKYWILVKFEYALECTNYY